MKITQYSKTKNSACGIGLFSINLHKKLSEKGYDITTCDTLAELPESDLCIIHGLKDIKQSDLNLIKCKKKILFLHFNCNHLLEFADAFIVMNDVLKPPFKQCLCIPHPGYVGETRCREELKNKSGLTGYTVVGSNGFINKKRQFVEISRHLLKQHQNLIINLIASKHHAWEHDDICDELNKIDGLIWDSNFKTHSEINQQMQMCDLLWCWTSNKSADYASGVISDQYASGTRIIANNIIPHKHLLGLDNIIFTPNNIDDFLRQLDEEINNKRFYRHQIFPHTWTSIVDQIVDFLHKQLFRIPLI